MKTSKFFATMLLCACVAPVCRADTVYLVDGTEINGTIVQQDSSTVVVKLANGTTRSIRRGQVDTIVKDAPKPAAREFPKSEPITPVGISPPAKLTPSSAPVTPTTGTTVEPKLTTPPITDKDKVPATDKPAVTPTEETAKTETKPGDLGPNPMPNFPENSKRMSKRKESLLRDALDAVKGNDEAAREAATSDMQGLGAEVVPYMWAGVQDESAPVRIASMKVIGNLGARNCTKRVIETLYMTMPEASQAATWNVPFVRVMKTTLASLTGQAFITGEPKSPSVQDGLKKYIEWYNANADRLPRQVGEPELDAADPDYAKKLAEMRKLKLTKREWPRSGDMPVDLVSGPNNTVPPKEAQVLKDSAEREADKKFAETIPKVGRDEANKNSAQPVLNKENAFKRDIDIKNEKAGGAANAARDPVPQGVKDPVKGEAPKAADALKRPQDIQREQEKKDRGY